MKTIKAPLPPRSAPFVAGAYGQNVFATPWLRQLATARMQLCNRSLSYPTIRVPSLSDQRSRFFPAQDGGTHLQIHGYTQADDRMFFDTIHGELDTFLFRRIRPLFEGTLCKAVDFRFMPDFGQSTYQVQEAFLELKTLKYARLRVGKFKEPIGVSKSCAPTAI